ncbi:YggS family pyridoxal phosphate-dependent enzyme [Aquirufa aurantiipilula]|uniref:Pyridoxal phosphate homeostasis protein n=1 Tax=Aquirufa aurantiipilula TaxID=2696561 RepID=A0ABT6BKQ3_9BACT|nr:YggS family pyridoxal phosphate-dependent enzyme [Aquirufa aurantiipilula]MDF5690524.1 YggS family pyridoxal phosphate-dependent enzyme [Aquirufa aurantiipilula]
MSIAQHISDIQAQLKSSSAKLIAVTKTRSIDELRATYDAGILDFGENRVQEMVEKQSQLPTDIRWHQIGHLQTNKVKYIAPFVHLIHSVDSFRLLKEIDTQGKKHGRCIPCLFQMYIAQEESKFGLDKEELLTILASPEFAELSHIKILGLMGMASFTDNEAQVAAEFQTLHDIFIDLQTKQTGYETGLVEWKELSMGMSGDYLLAAHLGSTMVRVGSAIYGARS